MTVQSFNHAWHGYVIVGAGAWSEFWILIFLSGVAVYTGMDTKVSIHLMNGVLKLLWLLWWYIGNIGVKCMILIWLMYYDFLYPDGIKSKTKSSQIFFCWKVYDRYIIFAIDFYSNLGLHSSLLVVEFLGIFMHSSCSLHIIMNRLVRF